jgi:N-acetylglucosamine-6-phosphate deacetylase
MGAGHTDADADEYFRAVDHGLKIAIHFTNGPTGSTFKPFGGGGVLQAVLGSRKVFAELIVDGYHVSPAYILDIIKRKGRDRVVAVSDSMFVTGDKSVSDFTVSGIAGRRSDNGHYLEVVGKHRTLFGSVLTMPLAFANLVSWMTKPLRGIWNDVHEPVDLEDAVLAATHFCSVNPAKVLGIFDPPSRRLGQDISMYTGGIQVGKRADIALVRLHGEPGAYTLTPDHVLIKGQLVK